MILAKGKVKSTDGEITMDTLINAVQSAQARVLGLSNRAYGVTPASLGHLMVDELRQLNNLIVAIEKAMQNMKKEDIKDATETQGTDKGDNDSI